jgi:hypothetical protein
MNHGTKFCRPCLELSPLTILTSSLPFYPYQTDERALTGYLLTRCSLSPHTRCLLFTATLQLSFLTLKGLTQSFKEHCKSLRRKHRCYDNCSLLHNAFMLSEWGQDTFVSRTRVIHSSFLPIQVFTAGNLRLLP